MCMNYFPQAYKIKTDVRSAYIQNNVTLVSTNGVQDHKHEYLSTGKVKITQPRNSRNDMCFLEFFVTSTDASCPQRKS